MMNTLLPSLWNEDFYTGIELSCPLDRELEEVSGEEEYEMDYMRDGMGELIRTADETGHTTTQFHQSTATEKFDLGNSAAYVCKSAETEDVEILRSCAQYGETPENEELNIACEAEHTGFLNSTFTSWGASSVHSPRSEARCTSCTVYSSATVSIRGSSCPSRTDHEHPAKRRKRYTDFVEHELLTSDVKIGHHSRRCRPVSVCSGAGSTQLYSSETPHRYEALPLGMVLAPVCEPDTGCSALVTSGEVLG